MVNLPGALASTSLSYILLLLQHGTALRPAQMTDGTTIMTNTDLIEGRRLSTAHAVLNKREHLPQERSACEEDETATQRLCHSPERTRDFYDICTHDVTAEEVERDAGSCWEGEVCIHLTTRRWNTRYAYCDDVEEADEGPGLPKIPQGKPGERLKDWLNRGDGSWTGASESSGGKLREDLDGPAFGVTQWDDAETSGWQLQHATTLDAHLFECALQAHSMMTSAGYHIGGGSGAMSTTGKAIGLHGRAVIAKSSNIAARTIPEDQTCTGEGEHWLGRYCYGRGSNDYYDSCSSPYSYTANNRHVGECSEDTQCTQFTDKDRHNHIWCEPVATEPGQSRKPAAGSRSTESGGSGLWATCLNAVSGASSSRRSHRD